MRDISVELEIHVGEHREAKSVTYPKCIIGVLHRFNVPDGSATANALDTVNRREDQINRLATLDTSVGICVRLDSVTEQEEY